MFVTHSRNMRKMDGQDIHTYSSNCIWVKCNSQLALRCTVNKCIGDDTKAVIAEAQTALGKQKDVL